MHRPLAIILLLAAVAAPVLAANGSGREQAGDCPLVEPAAAGDSGPARRAAAAPEANTPPGVTPARSEAPAPRSRARWHSLLPGMIK
jgi:hypothetical protein